MNQCKNRSLGFWKSEHLRLKWCGWLAEFMSEMGEAAGIQSGSMCFLQTREPVTDWIRSAPRVARLFTTSGFNGSSAKLLCISFLFHNNAGCTVSFPCLVRSRHRGSSSLLLRESKAGSGPSSEVWHTASPSSSPRSGVCKSVHMLRCARFCYSFHRRISQTSHACLLVSLLFLHQFIVGK